VQKDVNGIIKYYEGVSPALADESWEELGRTINLIEQNVARPHPVERGLQRVNLRRFPYHILFRHLPMTVRITAVRHHKRRPNLGMSRH